MLSATLSAQLADSSYISKEKPCKTVLNTLLAPTILIGTGIATMYDRGWYSSQDAHECIQEHNPDFHTKVDNYLVALPAIGVYGLNWAGVKGKNNFLDRSLIYLVSVSLAGITSGIIKRSTDVLRPDDSDYLSFPSSHTALAFASATFLHEEYKDQSVWYGVAGYSVATASGVLRMLNNKHWMSDVLVGAGIGILATKVTYLLYPLVKDCLGSRDKYKEASNLSLVPYVAANHYGIHLKYQIH
jgi:membrane-associated phospholipid phosphatase